MRRILLSMCLAVGASPSLASDCTVTKDQYDALRDGISYRQAVNILGCDGEEMSSSGLAGFKTVMYMWNGNSMFGNMNAMFQNDSMIAKAQFGLK